jgi:hypothetical protein
MRVLMLLCAGLETGEGRDSMSTIKMKSDGTVITSLRMPVETWQRLKLQAVAERTDMRDIILRGVERELGQRTREAGAPVAKAT